MWRSKKFIIAIAAAVVLLVGSVGGVALAQTGGAAATAGKTLMGRVAAILGIDQQKLEDAFTQARRDMQVEALDKHLSEAVAAGRMTQTQADQYKQWWLARPDVQPYREQLEKWQQARPDVPMPGRMGKAFPRIKGGMMRGW